MKKEKGTKFAPFYEFNICAVIGKHQSRLSRHEIKNENPFGKEFDDLFNQRIQEADEFYETVITE